MSLTEKQKELLLDLVQGALILGFIEPWPWLLSLENQARVFQHPTQEDRVIEAYETVRDYLNNVFPVGVVSEREYTLEDVLQAVNNYSFRCCYPGCRLVGEVRVEGAESTNLLLCEGHEGCVRAPEKISES